MIRDLATQIGILAAGAGSYILLITAIYIYTH